MRCLCFEKVTESCQFEKHARRLVPHRLPHKRRVAKVRAVGRPVKIVAWQEGVKRWHDGKEDLVAPACRPLPHAGVAISE